MPNDVNITPTVGKWIVSAFTDFTAKYAVNIVNASNPTKVDKKLTKYWGISVTKPNPFSITVIIHMPLLLSQNAKTKNTPAIVAHFICPFIGLFGLSLNARMNNTIGIPIEATMQGKPVDMIKPGLKLPPNGRKPQMPDGNKPTQ